VKRQRPFGVTMIALMQALAAPTAGVSMFFANTAFGVSDLWERISSAAVSLLGVLGIVIAVGLWRLQRWAWVATMLWFGFTMVEALITYAAGEPQYGIMVLSIITVFYLNQRDVQQAFRARTTSDDDKIDNRAAPQLAEPGDGSSWGAPA
jgi:hypothetical protein